MYHREMIGVQQKILRMWLVIAIPLLWLLTPIVESSPPSLSATWIQVDGERLSARLQDISLRDVLRNIADQSGIAFLVDPGVDGKVSITLNSAPIPVALRRILREFNHVLVQHRNQAGRRSVQLVRILRDGALTTPNFEVIKGESNKGLFSQPAGGFRNYGMQLRREGGNTASTEKPELQKSSLSNHLSPGLRNQKMQESRQRLHQLYLQAAQRKRMQHMRTMLEEQQRDPTVSPGKGASVPETPSARKRALEQIKEQHELTQTLVKHQQLADTPEEKLNYALKLEEQQSREQSKKNIAIAGKMKKSTSESQSVKFNLFPKGGERVLERN